MLTGMPVGSSLSENVAMQSINVRFSILQLHFIHSSFTKTDDPTSLWCMASVKSTINIVVMGTT